MGTLYDRLASGEAVTVRVSHSGEVITINWYEEYGLHWLRIVKNGRTVKRGVPMDRWSLGDWCFGVVPV